MASTPPWAADRFSEALCLRSELPFTRPPHGATAASGREAIQNPREAMTCPASGSNMPDRPEMVIRPTHSPISSKLFASLPDRRSTLHQSGQSLVCPSLGDNRQGALGVSFCKREKPPGAQSRAASVPLKSSPKKRIQCEDIPQYVLLSDQSCTNSGFKGYGVTS